MKKRNYRDIVVSQVEHLIRVCENCASDGKHLNPESLAVILRRIRTDMKRVGTDYDRAATGA